MADECKHRLPLIKATQNIIDAASKVLYFPDTNDRLRKQCIEIRDDKKDVISTQTVREIYHTLRNKGENIFLHKLVEETVFVLQPVVLPPRNPELEARIQKMKIAEENKEYKRMTQNLQPRGKKAFSFQDDVKSMNRQMIAMLNFALTVVAGFAFGYKGTELMFGKIFPMQMMAGLILGTVVFFVDLYFIMRYGV